MVYVKYNSNGTNQCPVDTIYYDTTGVPQEILNQCIQVDSIPTPTQQTGKQAVLYADTVGKTVFYGYIDIMQSVSQVDLNNIKSQNAQMLLTLVQKGLM